MALCAALVLTAMPPLGWAQGATVEQLLQECGNARSGTAAAQQACSLLIESKLTNTETSTFAYYNRAVGGHVTGRSAEAISDLTRAIELSPNAFEPHALRGVLYGEAGDLTAARQDFVTAARLNPKDAVSLSNLALTYERENNLGEALRIYGLALEQVPDYEIALSGRCWTRAALGRELQQALGDCDAALQRNPKDYNVYNSRGFVHFRLGHMKAAIDDYDRAIAGDPTVASSYYVRGLAKRVLGGGADAEADVARGIELQPNVVERYKGFGIVVPTPSP